MAWLSDYTHRLSFEVANPTTTGNRAIDAVPFPGPFLLAQGIIVDYNDVHVTTADGTTELPCELDAAKTALYVDYASMPAGRTTLYVYVGKTGASAPTACSYYTAARETAGIVGAQTAEESGGTLVDNGFEDGTEGTTLGAATSAYGTPQAREYDSAQYWHGAQSAYIKGGTGTTNAGFRWNCSLTADGAELRWGFRFGAANIAHPWQHFVANINTDGTHAIDFASDGNIKVKTARTGITGYTAGTYMTVGTYVANAWFEMRMVLDFTNQTYTLSKRSGIGDEWTQLKPSGAADYNIPFHGTNTISAYANSIVFCNSDGEFWVDDLRYSNTTGAITDTLIPAATSTLVQVIPPRQIVTADDDTSPSVIVSGEDVDFLHIASLTPTTYYGDATSHKAGWRADATDTLYLTASQATRFGATRYLLAESDASSETSFSGTDAENIRVSISTSTSDGTLTSRGAAQVAITGDRTKASGSVNVTVASDYACPASGGVAVSIQTGGVVRSFYSPVADGHILKAGTYAVTFPWAVTDWDGEAGTAVVYHGGGNASVSHDVFTGEGKSHLLAKFFEGALPLGTSSGGTLWLHGTPTVAADGDLLCFRNANVGHGTTYGIQHIASGWGKQRTAPNWNTRVANFQPSPPNATTVAWQTPGGTHADEYGTASPATLALTTADNGVEGWYGFTIPAGWFDDWQGDYLSQGVLIAHDGETGGDCYITVDDVVWQADYSALDADQLGARKLTTNTSWVTTPYSGERLTVTVPNGFGVHLSMNSYMRFDLHLVSANGGISRVLKDFEATPPGFDDAAFSWTNWPTGLAYDPEERRYWILTSTYGAGTAGIVIGYSAVDDPTSWTWSAPAAYEYPYKMGFAVYNGVAYIGGHYNPDPGIGFRTYTRATDTWSAITTVVTNSITGLTERTLSGDHDASVTTLTLNAAPDDYPSVGFGLIDYEAVMWRGKSGSTLTDVTRAMFGTTAASHSSGATVNLQEDELGAYVNVSLDQVNSRVHMTWTTDVTHWEKAAGVDIGPAYTGIYHAYHNLADAIGVWKDAAGNTLTLPLTIKTMPRISGSAFGGWNHNLLTLSDGTTLVTYGDQYDKDARSGLRQNDAKIRRLNADGLIDIVDAGIISPALNMVDLGDGNVAFIGVEQETVTSAALSVSIMRSDDSGATVGTPEELASHTLSGGYLWEPTMSETADLAGKGLLAYHHLNYFGAIYLTAINLIPNDPTNVVATVNGTDVDVTFTDNCSFEDGIKWRRVVNGVAGIINTIATPDTTGFTDTEVPTSYSTLVYEVTSYYGTVTSTWVASNTLASVTAEATYGVEIGFNATGSKGRAADGGAEFAIGFAAESHRGALADAPAGITLTFEATGYKGSAAGADFDLETGFEAVGSKQAFADAAFGVEVGFDASGADAQEEEGIAGYGVVLGFTATGHKGASADVSFGVRVDFGVTTFDVAVSRPWLPSVSSGRPRGSITDRPGVGTVTDGRPRMGRVT